MGNGIAYERAYRFSIDIVRVYQKLVQEKREYVLSKQLLRCGTSIGANLAEAGAAISDNDLSAKVSIAYKECQETKYWLNLMKDTDYLTESTFGDLHKKADEIGAILFATLRKTRMKGR